MSRTLKYLAVRHNGGDRHSGRISLLRSQLMEDFPDSVPREFFTVTLLRPPTAPKDSAESYTFTFTPGLRDTNVFSYYYGRKSKLPDGWTISESDTDRNYPAYIDDYGPPRELLTPSPDGTVFEGMIGTTQYDVTSHTWEERHVEDVTFDVDINGNKVYANMGLTDLVGLLTTAIVDTLIRVRADAIKSKEDV